MPKTSPTKDRFDDLPADRGRVGAHRAENPRIRGGLVLLWSVIAGGPLAASGFALIAARQSGTTRRVMRYYSGDGKERPIDFTCQVGPGPRPGVMVEDCAGHGLSFQNSYLPGAGVSRQWIGPGLGYATIQVLRN